MIAKFTSLKSIILFLLLLFFGLPISTKAIGLVTKPIEISDALRGKTYQDEMIVVNSDKTIERLKFISAGQIAGWANFFALSDKTNATTTAEISPSGRLNIIVKFFVPTSTPNGTYQGSIGVKKLAGSQTVKNESVASLEQIIEREVTITVKDLEMINFNVSVIPASYAPKPNEPLSIRFIYDNQGNVSIQPQIQIKIIKDEFVHYNVIYPFPDGTDSILPGQIQEISKIEIPTTNLQNGKYLADLNFLIDGQRQVHKQFNFIIGTAQTYVAWYQPFMRWEFFTMLGILALAVSLMNVYLVRKKLKIRKKPSYSIIPAGRERVRNPAKQKITTKDLD